MVSHCRLYTHFQYRHTTDRSYPQLGWHQSSILDYYINIERILLACIPDKQLYNPLRYICNYTDLFPQLDYKHHSFRSYYTTYNHHIQPPSNLHSSNWLSRHYRLPMAPSRYTVIDLSQYYNKLSSLIFCIDKPLFLMDNHQCTLDRDFPEHMMLFHTPNHHSHFHLFSLHKSVVVVTCKSYLPASRCSHNS